jgi:hypothetical protein
LDDVRNTINSDANGAASGRRLYFTPHSDGRIAIRLEATGVDSPDSLAISQSDRGSVTNGAVELEVSTAVRYTLNVALSEPYAGPIEITAVGEEVSEVHA